MNKILFFLILFCNLGYSQPMSPDPLWSKGDILIGVNTDLTERSWTDVILTPTIGYALTDKDLIYANFSYTDTPQRSAYRLGYNRSFGSVYAGIGGSLSKFQSDTYTKYFCLEAGIGKNVCDWLLITPKVAFGHLWDESVTQFTLSTSITCAIKI